MKRTFTSLWIFISVLLFVQTSHAQLDKSDGQLSRRHWQTKKIRKGIYWSYYHETGLFDSRQSINVLDVRLKKSKIRLRLAYSDSILVRTSDFAISHQALAALNGSYFDTKNGGSVNFLRANGLIIDTTAATVPLYRDDAGIAIDADGQPRILQKPAGGWETVEVPTLLSSGPLLVYGGNLVNQVVEKFAANRHPRTAVGLTADHRLLLVTVDGRSADAYGMTTTELAQLMLALGCTQAMNLDGGGSTTLWIKEIGVVNFPCDNKRYDHAGERAVANCLLLN